MNTRLDSIDVKILSAVQNNARITNLTLSEKVSLPASAGLARVHRLRDKGFVARDMSLIDPEKPGTTLRSLLEVTLYNS